MARWQCSFDSAKETMERHGFERVPYGSRSWRYRMADVLEAEAGKPRPSILRQLAEEVRGR